MSMKWCGFGLTLALTVLAGGCASSGPVESADETAPVVSVDDGAARSIDLEGHMDLFVDGDNGVASYRIPALTVSNAGTLIAVADARVPRGGDLPNNIDLVMRRSVDLGDTWSAPAIIVDYPGMEGAGDAALLTDRDTGRIWLFYVYGPERIGWKQSQPGIDGPTLQLHLRWSDDDGVTWSDARNLNPELKDPAWSAVWSSPGNGVQTRAGGLYFPLSQHSDTLYSRYIHSDDHGATWRITPPAGRETNESMLVELDNGALMANMRSGHGKNQRAVAYSHDGGQTWEDFHHDPNLPEPVCQAALLRYSSVRDGAARSRLLFSNPASKERENMTVRLSYDEGRTWPVSRVIFPGPAAYSCMAVLPDGSVGVFYERGEKSAAERMTFTRFTLDWLTDGADVPQNN